MWEITYWEHFQDFLHFLQQEIYIPKQNTYFYIPAALCCCVHSSCLESSQEGGEAIITKPWPSHEPFRLWTLVMVVSTSKQDRKRFNCPKSSTEVEFVVSNFWAEISKIFDLVDDNGNDKYLTKKSNLLFVLSRVYYGAGIGNMIWGGR